MLNLKAILPSWGTENFSHQLKQVLQGLSADQLPLQQGTAHGGYVGEEAIQVTVNRFSEQDGKLVGSVGVFFTEIMINCGCGDDPMPMNGYCVLQLCIDKTSGESEVCVVEEHES